MCIFLILFCDSYAGGIVIEIAKQNAITFTITYLDFDTRLIIKNYQLQDSNLNFFFF